MSHRVQIGLRLVSAAVLAGILWFVPIAGPGAFPLCGFHWLTGKPCPLCGLTRAFAALLHGQWNTAIHLHALSPVAFALTAGILAGLPPRRIPWGWLATLFAVYGVARLAGG